MIARDKQKLNLGKSPSELCEEVFDVILWLKATSSKCLRLMIRTVGLPDMFSASKLIRVDSQIMDLCNGDSILYTRDLYSEWINNWTDLLFISTWALQQVSGSLDSVRLLGILIRLPLDLPQRPCGEGLTFIFAEAPP